MKPVPERRDLGVEAAEGRTDVVEPVPDLDRDRLQPGGPDQGDVDGP